MDKVQATWVTQTVNNLPAVEETQGQSLCQEDALEKGMGTYSSILSWRCPWTDHPGGLLPSMESQRVRHDCVTEHKTAQLKLRK